MGTRRHRLQVFAVFAAAVFATVGTIAAISSNSGGTAAQDGAGRASESTRPEPAKSQSTETWVDTQLTPLLHVGVGWRTRRWMMPEPLRSIRGAWYDVVSRHLNPAGELSEPDFIHSPSYALESRWLLEPTHTRKTWVQFGILRDDGRSVLELGCPLIPASVEAGWACRQDPLLGLPGKEAWLITPWNRCAWSPPQAQTCDGDGALVMVKRAHQTLAYIMAHGRGRPGRASFPLGLMVNAAADPRLDSPAEAFGVPWDSTVASVVQDHFPSSRPEVGLVSTLGVGRAEVHVELRTSRIAFHQDLNVTVIPAGRAPRCGPTGVQSCVARQVYGPDDPTTVYVGRWANEAGSWKELVYVGPRNTVSALATDMAWLLPGRQPNLEKRIIDLMLDPRLQ